MRTACELDLASARGNTFVTELTTSIDNCQESKVLSFILQLKLRRELAASVRDKSRGDWSCYVPVTGAITVKELSEKT